MYTIVMRDDKSLRITEKATLYQREKLIDKIQFLIPKTYEGTDISGFTATLKYVDQGNVAHMEILTLTEDEDEDPSLVLSTGINDSITLSGLKEPKSNSDAANKIYVDSQIDSNKFVKDTNNISGQGVNSNMMIQDLIDIITEKVTANVNSINSLNTNKANTNHTHDDRYYTESEVNNLLNGKANTIHITDTDSMNISASNWTTSASGMKYFNSVTFSSLGITGTVIGCYILEWSGTQHLITCSAYLNNYIQFRAETATVATVRVRIVWI